MTVGPVKGKIVTDAIVTHKPKCMIELGSYIGYSTILFANAVKQNGGQQYISFERDPKFAKVASSLVEMAGLSDFVRFVIGSSSKNIVAEHSANRLTAIDMMFLDHYKPSYVRDLKICESLGLVRKGTVLAADNVITPGNPSYLAYVRSSVHDKKEQAAAGKEKADAVMFPEHTVKQYKDDVETDDTEAPGNPGLVYESHLMPGAEPTGDPDAIELTICTRS